MGGVVGSFLCIPFVFRGSLCVGWWENVVGGESILGVVHPVNVPRPSVARPTAGGPIGRPKQWYRSDYIGVSFPKMSTVDPPR